ncbi:hypothetical protein [Streptomyces atratus]|uniref:hypothetical protein n=1 Tax=Streptomyces atratus TaxID=1893 RepID=UPI0036489EB2
MARVKFSTSGLAGTFGAGMLCARSRVERRQVRDDPYRQFLARERRPQPLHEPAQVRRDGNADAVQRAEAGQELGIEPAQVRRDGDLDRTQLNARTASVFVRS